MMRLISTIIFAVLCYTQALNGQSVQDEIDRDVWFPFKAAFDSFDADAQFAVHSNDVLRINRDAQFILAGEEYHQMLLQSAERNKERNAVRTIDLSFIERFHTGNFAYEVGYYRVGYAAGELQSVTYGYFHVILEKQDGKWKILADSDISNDGAYTEEDFMSGVILGANSSRN